MASPLGTLVAGNKLHSAAKKRDTTNEKTKEAATNRKIGLPPGMWKG